MKLVSREIEKNRVRIIIGKLEKGHSSVRKPIMSIVLADTCVEEVHKMILNSIKEAIKDEKHS